MCGWLPLDVTSAGRPACRRSGTLTDPPTVPPPTLPEPHSTTYIYTYISSYMYTLNPITCISTRKVHMMHSIYCSIIGTSFLMLYADSGVVFQTRISVCDQGPYLPGCLLLQAIISICCANWLVWHTLKGAVQLSLKEVQGSSLYFTLSTTVEQNNLSTTVEQNTLLLLLPWL